MPTRLQARFEAGMVDPELLSLKDDVALIQAKISERLAEISDSDSAGAPKWSDVLDRVEDILENFMKRDWTRNQKDLQALAEAVGSRRDEESIWRDIRSMIDQKARLATAESKRLADLEQNLTVEQALTFATVLADIVKRHVPDQEVLRAIGEDLRQATNLEQAAGRIRSI